MLLFGALIEVEDVCRTGNLPPPNPFGLGPTIGSVNIKALPTEANGFVRNL